MKKVGLVSLGCSKNRVDSENILGLLEHDGYHITNSIEESDIIVINTCGFIDPSKQESIETIFEMASYGKKIVVTGCLAERYYDVLKKEMPEIDLIIPINKYGEFNNYFKQVDDELKETGGLNDEYRVLSTDKFTAYLKIGEGCSNRCAFCAIPLIRGGFKSRPFDDIIKEAKNLADNGVKEIVVLEQDTTRYGVDLIDKKNIVELLHALLEIKELEYIRLLYLYPDEISDDLIDLIGGEKRLTPYFDIPIQHSEDRVLKAMYRRGDKQSLISLFNKIKERVPNAILRTTIMVGFPGETEEDFNNLLTFIEEVGFDHLGCFKYSREENTPAYNFPNQIDEKIKQERYDKVMKLQQKISYRHNKKHIGEVMEGLIIDRTNDGYLVRTYWNAPDDVDGKIILSTNEKFSLGDNVTIKITEAFVYDLLAELYKE